MYLKERELKRQEQGERAGTQTNEMAKQKAKRAHVGTDNLKELAR